jgi:hypothetical protein
MEFVLILIVLINFTYATVLLMKNPQTTGGRSFIIVTLIATIWTFSNFMTETNGDLFWFKTSYATGAFLMSSGFIWICGITGSKIHYIRTLVPAFLLFFLSFCPGFVNDAYQSHIILHSQTNWLIICYGVVYLYFSFYMIFKLYIYTRSSQDPEKKKVRLVFYGSIISLTIIAISSFVFPLFSIYFSGSIDSISFLCFLLLVGYSVTKHKLFKIDIIILEPIVYLLWIFLVIQLIISHDLKERILIGSSLLITVIFGTLLIKVMQINIRQRKEIEALSKIVEQTDNLMDKFPN